MALTSKKKSINFIKSWLRLPTIKISLTVSNKKKKLNNYKKNKVLENSESRPWNFNNKFDLISMDLKTALLMKKTIVKAQLKFEECRLTKTWSLKLDSVNLT